MKRITLGDKKEQINSNTGNNSIQSKNSMRNIRRKLSVLRHNNLLPPIK
jgi:hypothetical protein